MSSVDAIMDDQNTTSGLESLDDHCLVQCLSFLRDHRTLCLCKEVSTRFRELCTSDEIWCPLLATQFGVHLAQVRTNCKFP